MWSPKSAKKHHFPSTDSSIQYLDKKSTYLSEEDLYTVHVHECSQPKPTTIRFKNGSLQEGTLLQRGPGDSMWQPFIYGVDNFKFIDVSDLNYTGSMICCGTSNPELRSLVASRYTTSSRSLVVDLRQRLVS